mmetsp:Transcript_149906/g.417684  ORF Transcript_149906/g.417684 Transcript_149906/m.417684 type:complete len:252 (-) Transcript_149906:628-1383(-)
MPEMLPQPAWPTASRSGARPSTWTGAGRGTPRWASSLRCRSRRVPSAGRPGSRARRSKQTWGRLAEVCCPTGSRQPRGSRQQHRRQTGPCRRYPRAGLPTSPAPRTWPSRGRHSLGAGHPRSPLPSRSGRRRPVALAGAARSPARCRSAPRPARAAATPSAAARGRRATPAARARAPADQGQSRRQGRGGSHPARTRSPAARRRARRGRCRRTRRGRLCGRSAGDCYAVRAPPRAKLHRGLRKWPCASPVA